MITISSWIKDTLYVLWRQKQTVCIRKQHQLLLLILKGVARKEKNMLSELIHSQKSEKLNGFSLLQIAQRNTIIHKKSTKNTQAVNYW